MNRSCFRATLALAVFGLCRLASAEPGVVITKDGQVLRGELARDKDTISITRAGKTTRLPAANVKSARFEREIEEDYLKRLIEAKSDDLNRQVEILRWCDEQGWPELVVRQAQGVLRLKVDQGEARALLKKANDAIRAAAAEHKSADEKPKPRTKAARDASEEHAGDDSGGEGATRKLTKEEINRIRFMELRALREKTGPDIADIPVDQVQVGIPKSVIDDFLKEVEGQTGYDGREGRERFLRLPPERKLAEIAYNKDGDKYMDKVDIKTDPEAFMTFKIKVMPVILRNCATASCHGGADADKTGLRLWTDPKRTADSVYTNFLLLDEIEINHQPMLDRDRPERSLLLAWLLRPDKTENRIHHPGNAKLKPVFQNTDNAGYKNIFDWIRTLRLPHPDYRVQLRKKPASAPADDADKPDKMMEKP